MSERVLRGSRLGATSYETDRNADLAPRRSVRYVCPARHDTTVPFAVEAELPATWQCRICGRAARLVDGPPPVPRPTKPARTHWDMLLERRSVDALEEVLAERLNLLREDSSRQRRRTA
ncbi:MAG TPA: RNA polymerase-binding protein RbpA [Streptosporangiaceae bacterium]|nr:RNA polymerase-binding protein RbpA [Streptosporangiaceae bacterium]